MPSNDQLKTDIDAVAAKLGEDAPDTSNMNNVQLAETLKNLNARAAVPSAEQPPAEQPSAEQLPAVATAASNGPRVAKGKAVTAKRKILSDGDPISADDLSGGKDAFEALVKSGHIDDK